MNLIYFLSMYGICSTSNFQLKYILNDLNLFGKVLMKDELNEINSTKKSNIIMNLQTSKNDGSHWVALFRSDKLNYYFDPYGVLPTKKVYTYLNKTFSWNKIQVQQNGMECCGQLSMYFLYQMNTRTEEKAVEIILSMKKKLEYLQSLA